ncbi:MAG: hypothetical protein JWL84_4063 [Rhodospirillales bacterium]|jgi:uncharacterized protein YcbX|nr:hypothetical protein [Rhodospirillales bacterium]
MSVVELGTVAAINRYPVKSMAGESLDRASLQWTGIDGDRQYAFVRTGEVRRFPWMTGRQYPEMVTWRARYDDPADPRGSPVRVATGDGFVGTVDDPALLARLSRAAGEEVRLLQLGRGTHDSAPVSVIATATGELLAERLGAALDLRRFRPNIVIATAPGEASRETRWSGGLLVFGDAPDAARLHATVAIDRCVMVTLDPDTAAGEPAILRCVVQDFANQIGMRCTTATPGTIAVGDRVRLVTAAGEAEA